MSISNPETYCFNVNRNNRQVQYGVDFVDALVTSEGLDLQDVLDQFIRK